MNKKDKKELKKCIESPYYFATNHLVIKTPLGDQAFITRYSEKEFNKFYKKLKYGIHKKSRRRG